LKPHVHYRVHKHPQLDPNLSQTKTAAPLYPFAGLFQYSYCLV